MGQKTSKLKLKYGSMYHLSVHEFLAWRLLFNLGWGYQNLIESWVELIIIALSLM